MNKLNNILAGIDFSDCSRSALEQAVRLAKWNHAHLHALHALERTNPPGGTGWGKKLTRAVRRW